MEFNRFAWNNYLQTERGKKAIKNLSEKPAIIDLTFQYNKELKKNWDNKKSKDFIQIVIEDYANKC